MKKKKIPFILAGLSLLFVCCKKQTIPTYSASHYVQFTEGITDTASISFFFYPNQNEIEYALPVKLIGLMPEKDLEYSIEIVPKETTAANSHYSLKSRYTFSKGQSLDTAYITVKNAAELSSKEVKLVLKIASTPSVQAGQTNYAYRVIEISDMVQKPAWWNANMDRFYLGVYSETKFRKFMEVVGVGDLSIYSPSEQRTFMLQFKYYLIDMKEAGTPVLLDDGSDMLESIPLIG